MPPAVSLPPLLLLRLQLRWLFALKGPDQGGQLEGRERVRDLRAILTGGLLMIEVKSVSDLLKKPFWKAGFRRSIQASTLTSPFERC